MAPSFESFRTPTFVETQSQRRQQDPLPYETISLHPGRMRITESPDALQIELVQRPAWNSLPWITLTWSWAIALMAILWLTTFTGPKAYRVLLTATAPLAALFITWGGTLQDRQRLTLRIDRSGLTISRYATGNQDQHIPLSSIVAIYPEVGEGYPLLMIGRRGGGEYVRIARKAKYLVEICTRLNQAAERFRELTPHKLEL